ncbi:MAG: hypothetical protein RL701_5617 [Pseudomonadota bacterium]|jgi:hypothetical protein
MSNMSPRLARSSVCLLLLAISRVGIGCADIVDLPDAPTLVGETPSCISSVAKPLHETAQITVRTCNFVKNCDVAVSGVKAVLCYRQDANCDYPLPVAIADKGDGTMTFEVVTGGPEGKGFNGYLMVTAPEVMCTDKKAFGDSSSGEDPCLIAIAAKGCDLKAPDERCLLSTYNPALLFFNPPITNDVATPIMLPLLPTLTAIDYTRAAGTKKVDPTLGSVFATAVDCRGRPTSGVTFGVSSGRPEFGILYPMDGVATPTSTTTDESGIGGLLGIPPGAQTVNLLQPTGTGSVQTLASETVQVRSASITYVTLIASQ